MAPTTRSQHQRRSASAEKSKLNSSFGVIRSAFYSMYGHYLERDCLLTSHQLKRLGEHKYSASDSSWLEKPMKKFWDLVVEQYPLWLAPNLITLLGLMINISAVLLLSYYSPDAKRAAPWWAYVFCGLGQFIYQTLDATDGKQARRTGTASPLGELFDHGCDSLAQVFVSLEVSLSLQLGHYHTAVVFVTAFAVFMFYCAHWQTYVSGTMKFTKFDVTEAQMCVIALCLTTAFCGPNFWAIQLFGVELKILLIGICSVTAVYQSSYYLNCIFTGGVGKNGSTVADTSVLFPICPILAVIVPHMTIYAKSESGVFEDNCVVFLVCFGLVAAKITNRLVIAHMSKSPLELWDSIYLSPLLLMLNQYFNILLPEYPLLICCLLYCIFNLLLNCYYICWQICDYLNISCFRIDQDPRNRR